MYVPWAVPQNGVLPFDSLLVENSPLTPLSQAQVLTPPDGASCLYMEHEQLIPLPTTPKELGDLEPLPPLPSQDKEEPSTF